MIKIDVSGLEALQAALKLDREALNREFIEGEGNVFLDKVTGPEHPVDTELAENSWAVNDDIKQEGNVTESTWNNTAKNEQGDFYLGFVNWGTKNPDKSPRITPRLFFEKAINRINEGKEQRYQQKFKEAFNSALK